MSLRTPLGLHRVCAQDEDGAEDVTEGQRMLMLSLPPVPKVILRMAFSGIFKIFFQACHLASMHITMTYTNAYFLSFQLANALHMILTSQML